MDVCSKAPIPEVRQLGLKCLCVGRVADSTPAQGVHALGSRSYKAQYHLMEPIRAEVDAFVLDWIRREPLRRADFFEAGEGNCRLMSSLCRKLSETAPVWSRLVAPLAEYVARTLWAERTGSRQFKDFPRG